MHGICIAVLAMHSHVSLKGKNLSCVLLEMTGEEMSLQYVKNAAGYMPEEKMKHGLGASAGGGNKR